MAEKKVATRKYYSGLDYDIFHYADTLYNLRSKMNMTMREMASFIGTNIATYQTNEQGKITKIPKDLVDSVIEKFGIAQSEILKPRITTDKLNPIILKWLYTEEAIPYILQAYNQYEEDRRKKEPLKKAALLEKAKLVGQSI